jgi:hypothetical protein
MSRRRAVRLRIGGGRPRFIPAALLAVGSLLAGGLLTGAHEAQAAGAPPPPLVAAARLQGVWGLNGLVTKAVGVPGERAGQTFTRLWRFTPLCQAGACTAILLQRPRVGGGDRILLQRRGAGFYTGVGTFVAPLRCQGRTFSRGALVPFTISVQITAAGQLGTLVQATQLHATYRNRKRINLTRCVPAPSYDSAGYGGALISVGT